MRSSSVGTSERSRATFMEDKTKPSKLGKDFRIVPERESTQRIFKFTTKALLDFELENVGRHENSVLSDSVFDLRGLEGRKMTTGWAVKNVESKAELDAAEILSTIPISKSLLVENFLGFSCNHSKLHKIWPVVFVMESKLKKRGLRTEDISSCASISVSRPVEKRAFCRSGGERSLQVSKTSYPAFLKQTGAKFEAGCRG
ncbi:hypothetical protein R1flu_003176 [Riccia fluitans]|uniref:Uncharacterized protein n=1 Tax=Riccia fluitans TaxID=41844 RepID=A0ABD1Y889_9MARC